MARKYHHAMELLPQIEEMQAHGMSQKQIESALGLGSFSRCPHNLGQFTQGKEEKGREHPCELDT